MQLHQLTPTQLEWHHARKARQARMTPKPVAAIAAPIVEDVVVIEPPVEKPLWFHIVSEVPTTYPPVNKIVKVVAKHFNVLTTDIISARRTGPTILPRHTAMYLARTLTPRSTPDIARRFYRDHTVVLYAVKKISERMESDTQFAAAIAEMSDRLVNHVQ